MATPARLSYSATILVMLAAVAGLLAATALHASAATLVECQGQLTTLRGDTQAAADSFTSTKDVNGLVGKADAASADLAAGKNADALLKLDDYQAKLTDLASAPKPKVDPAEAATLASEAEQAAACISLIA